MAKINKEYRKRMYRLFKLYNKEYDPKYSIIYFDEKYKQLIDDLKPKIPMKIGSPEKYDYSYE